MRVIITGAKGLLGQAMAQQANAGWDVLALDHQQLDITDEGGIARVCNNFSPNLIINCAAIARVDFCETARELAWAVNCEAARKLAKAAHKSGAAILHISTDYVFDGAKRAPYTFLDE